MFFIFLEEEKAGDFERCDGARRLWTDVTDRGRIRRARLEALNSSYSLSASLIQEMNWIGVKIEFLKSTASKTQDTTTARDLQVVQRLCKKHQVNSSAPYCLFLSI